MSAEMHGRTGRRLGAIKSAAVKTGCSLSEYTCRRAAGEKWCTACRVWHPVGAFGRDPSRWDRLAARCLSSRSTGNPRGWHLAPAINPKTGRPGPNPKPARDGDKLQARARVNHEVQSGRRPNPNDISCADCGHKGEGLRHEYDHHMGYAAEHHFDVQPVCSRCHHSREDARRGKV
jgi:hypothetical protein